MKKFILFIISIVFILQIWPKEVRASTICIKYYDGCQVDKNDSLVLNSGYYLISSEYNPLEEKYFKGDYTYALLENYYDVSYRTFEENMLVLPDVENILEERLLNPFNEVTSGAFIKESGCVILYVPSYAVFHTERELYRTYLYYLPTKEFNSNTSIAGNMTHFVDVEKPISLLEIKSRYTATDNVDGNITEKIQYISNYNEKELSLGRYYILLSVEDSAGHVTYVADQIIVKDFTPPVLTLEKLEYTLEVHNPFTSTDAKKLFSASDNYTSSQKIKIDFIDSYQSQYHKVGDYTISATAYDLEKNKSETKTLTIHVIDQTAPTIVLTSGENKIIADHILNEDEIKSLFTVSDNYYDIDSSKIEIIENTCDGNQGKEFRIKVKVKDGSNNESEKAFLYYLTDTISPIIMVEKALYVPVGVSYTNEQIIQMLKDAGIISMDVKSVEIKGTTFDPEKESSYTISYQELLADGTIKDGKVQFKIFKEAEINPRTNNFDVRWLYLSLIPLSIIAIIFAKKRKKYEIF